MKSTKSNLLLLLAAFIWGCAFVAQSVAMDHIGPWTFNCARSLIGGCTLLPLIAWRNKKGIAPEIADAKVLWKGGILCGILLGIASYFQQTGIQYTTVGKAGFITALYVVFVPLLGMFLHKKVTPVLWLCVGCAMAGLYFLCMQESFSLSMGDSMVFICAILFAFHILCIDAYSPKTDGVKMSCIQFFVAGLISFVPMMLFEHPTLDTLQAAIVPILYAGVLSSGVGYTLQIIGQKDADPTIASLILSLESVFATLAGWVLLSQTLSLRELFGCLLVFIAIVCAELWGNPKEKPSSIQEER